MIQIRKLFTPFLLILLSLQVSATEGMWLPVLIGNNIEEMQRMGLQLSARDLYNEEGPCLKDGIVRFGRGCTGSFISAEGLLITNHHCGLGQIQNHSSLENDYLTQGFWAKNKSEELPNPGLTITLLVRMEDVTSQIINELRDDMTEKERFEAISERTKEIVKAASEEGKYEAQVAPFYYGNEYYLFVFQVFRDVRLVGAPPISMGSFGGDEDNWNWPRHTGNFSLFRVYANADNEPANFSPDNKPYRPAHFFPVSNKGIRENDFTMVYGFPGRTSQYLTSDAVDFIIEKQYPVSIDLRTRTLDIFNQEMVESDKVRIQYAAKHSGVSNSWKRWQGEIRGLDRLDAVNRKKELEKEFCSWAAQPENAKYYAGLMEAFEDVYREINPYRYASILYNEAGRRVEILRFAQGFDELVNKSKDRNTKHEEIDKLLERLSSSASAFFKDYHQHTDQRVMTAMLENYMILANEPLIPQVLRDIQRQYGSDLEKYAAKLFKRSILTSEHKTMNMLKNFKPSDVRKLEKDPVYALASSLASFYSEQIRKVESRLDTQLDSLYRLYVKGLREMNPEQNFFPDANSTLRITYGKAEGSLPRDGVAYAYFSTADGILEKAANRQIPDYRIPDELDRLIRNKDFQPYDLDGELIINFLASNHTTGGNSGSPVIGADGSFIGINFDRTWESTMSDIMFDPSQCRNVSVNSQYILWIIDCFAGMKYLLDEMVIVFE